MPLSNLVGENTMGRKVVKKFSYQVAPLYDNPYKARLITIILPAQLPNSGPAKKNLTLTLTVTLTLTLTLTLTENPNPNPNPNHNPNPNPVTYTL